MRTIDNYIGTRIKVLVDDSTQLRQLVEEAKKLRTVPFQEKLDCVKKLTLSAMNNAYEQMIVWGEKADGLEDVKVIGTNGEIDNSEYKTAKTQEAKFTDIVFQEHPLSYALEQEAGCCRYQGALFFVLSYEADLGDKHFIQVAPVNKKFNTVFNEVVYGKEHHKISIFTESLKDKSLDYSKQNPDILEQTITTRFGYSFFSYHRTPTGLVIVENSIEHIKTLEDTL
ncbi:MAG: hypothetical protein WC916_04255 [Candidatus Woesearchaeota archaeon]